MNILLCHRPTQAVDLLIQFEDGWCQFLVETGSQLLKLLSVDLAPAESIITLCHREIATAAAEEILAYWLLFATDELLLLIVRVSTPHDIGL